MNQQLLSFLIDDDIEDHDFFSMAMQDVNPDIQCAFATDGLHALEKFNADHSFKPDIIFLDINMPRMDGVQCLTEIKKQTSIKAIPVYMYSTSAQPEIVARCKQLGAIDFIQKVADLDKLQKILKKIIRTHVTAL